MAKAKKVTAKKQSKVAKDKALADGAAEIKKAQAEQKPKVEAIEIPESTRPIEDIIRERVQILPGSIGLTMDDNTPVEENVRVLDWAMALDNHVGFMIGDILNAGRVKWGDGYKLALDKSGRSYKTLAAYAETSARIPKEKRVAALTFSHHREMLRLTDAQRDDMLKTLEKEADKKGGYIPTKYELRDKIATMVPKKRSKRVTSGKHKKTGKRVEEKPYDPTDAEQELLEEGEMAVDETAKLLKPDGKLCKVLVQLDNKTKQRWLSKLDNIVLFFKIVQNKTSNY